MPFDDSGRAPGRELIPRATIETIVAHRDQAIALYGQAFTAIEAADQAIKAANAEAARAAGGTHCYYGDEGKHEIEEFEKAVRMPSHELYEAVAKRLVDLRVWSWVIQRTELENLMDAEAKEKLRRQMRYVPVTQHVRGVGRQLITGEEIENGMPPVTVENIYATIQQFSLDAESIFRRGIANAFSRLDRRFRSHDGFKVGSRVILPYAFSGYGGGLNYGRQRDELLDIERAFAVLDNGNHLGAQYGDGLADLSRDRGHQYGPHQSDTRTRYFRIRGYKNGNAHLWFTRDDLVRKVNKVLAEWYGEVIGDGQTRNPDIFSGAEFRLPAKRFGFYPTPDGLVEQVIEAAALWRGENDRPLTVLEPSAGTGQLARACAAERTGHVNGTGDKWRERREYTFRAAVDCVEIQSALVEILRGQGVYRRVVAGNFLQMQPNPKQLYDRVVMNPPFDLERDIEHVMHAMRFLKPDGRLVAIMSAGVEFRETRKAIAFRRLIEEKRGRFQDLPAGSFSSVGTNVNTILLTVNADGTRAYR